MARYDGHVKFDARIDSTKFKDDLNSIKSVSKKAFTAVGVAAGAMVTGIAAAGIGFESAFAGVKKTVNATTHELEALKGGIRDMAKEIPTAANEIAGIAESAGQLGIKTENILEFTRTMADLGVATNLAGEEAASTLAKFANITQMPQEQFSNLGSTIVALGNNLATTEADIAAMSLRLAGAGTQAGLSEAQILAFAGALSSVGIEAEAGGSAFSRVMTDMQLQVETNGDGLKNYAKVAGMTCEEFKNAFQKDAAGAIIEFIKGLNNTERNGKSATQVLAEMGIEEIRLSDALKRAAGASDVFENAIKLGNDAWEENNALTKEAEQRYQTTESKLKILGNQVKDLGISAWDAFSGQFGEGIDAASDKIEELSASMENGKLKGAMENVGDLFGSLVDAAVDLAGVALPPLVSILGLLGGNLGKVATVSLAVFAAMKTFAIAKSITGWISANSAVWGLHAGAITANTAAETRGITVSSLLMLTMSSQELVVGALTGKIGLLTAAKMLATKAQMALNAAWLANPVGIVAAGIAALTVAVIGVTVAISKETEAERQNREALEQSINKNNELKESLNASKEAREESTSSVVSEYEHIEKLYTELESLTDAEGKVSEANKGRAEFIINTLNGAIGTEIELTKDLAVQYGDAKDKIYELIEAKKAEALADVYKEDYTNALKQQKDAIDAVTTAQSNGAATAKAVADAKNQLSAAEDRLAQAQAAQIEGQKKAAEGELVNLDALTAAVQTEAQAVADANLALTQAQEAHQPFADAISTAEGNLNSINATVATYEDGMAALAEGNTQKAISTFQNVGAAATNMGTETKDALKQLGTNYQNNLNQLQSAIDVYLKTGSQSAYNHVISSAKQVEAARTEYVHAGGKIADGFVQTMEGKIDLSGVMNAISEAAIGVQTKATEVGTNIEAGVIAGMTDNGEVYGKGLEIGTQATDGVADGAGCHSPSEKTKQTGLYIDQGLANGIAAGKSGVVNAAIDVAKAAIIAANTTLDINSPSKVMRDGAGLSYDEGFADGIEKGTPMVTDAAIELGESAVNALEQSIDISTFSEKLGTELEKGLKENAEKMTEKFEKAVEVLDVQLDFGIISEEEYYQELKRLRDEYLTENTKEWYEATQEIYDFEKKAAKESLEYRYDMGLVTERQYYEGLEEYRDKYFTKDSDEWRDHTVEIFDYYKEEALKCFEDVADKQESMRDKLSDYGSFTKTVTIEGWNGEDGDLVWEELTDWDKDTEVLKGYADGISSVSERMKAAGFDADAISQFKSVFADMSVEEGASFAKLLASATDEKFYDYVSGYLEKEGLAEQLSKEIYGDEFTAAADESASILKKAFESAGYEVPEGFFDIGTKSAENFSESFLAEIGNMMQPFRDAILSCMPASFSMATEGVPGGQSYTANYNFYSNGDTTAQQIQAAQAASERDKLSGGY